MYLSPTATYADSINTAPIEFTYAYASTVNHRDYYGEHPKEEHSWRRSKWEVQREAALIGVKLERLELEARSSLRRPAPRVARPRLVRRFAQRASVTACRNWRRQ